MFPLQTGVGLPPSTAIAGVNGEALMIPTSAGSVTCRSILKVSCTPRRTLKDESCLKSMCASILLPADKMFAYVLVMTVKKLVGTGKSAGWGPCE